MPHAQGPDLDGCGLSPGPELLSLGYRFPLAGAGWEVGRAPTPCPALEGGFLPDLPAYCRRAHAPDAALTWLPDGRPICHSPEYVPDAVHAQGYWVVLPAVCALMYPDQAAIRHGETDAQGNVVPRGRLYPIVKMHDRKLECFYLDIQGTAPAVASGEPASGADNLISTLTGQPGSSGTYVPCGDIAAVRFEQTTLVIDGARHERTGWGRARLFYPGGLPSDLAYLHLAINGRLIFDNLPLRADGTPDQIIDIGLWFFLGTEDGVPVNGLGYVCDLTPEPLIGAPNRKKKKKKKLEPAKVDLKEIEVATVIFKEGTIKYKGPQTEDDRDWYPYGPDIKDKAFHVWTSMPNQECAPSQCFAAAVSNSLKYLKLAHPKAMQKVTDDPDKTFDGTDTGRMAEWSGTRPSFGLTGSGGTPSGTTNDPKAGWNRLQKQFDKRPEYPIETELVDDPEKFIRILELIKKKQDCELIAGAHAMVVTGVIQLRDGSFLFELADDTEQGMPGGTLVQLAHYDPVRKVFRGHPAIAGEEMKPGTGKALFVCHKIKTTATKKTTGKSGG